MNGAPPEDAYGYGYGYYGYTASTSDAGAAAAEDQTNGSRPPEVGVLVDEFPVEPSSS